MRFIRYQGRLVAAIHPPYITFSCRIAALSSDDPDWRWASCLALFALEVLEGRMRGPYTEARARLFARNALIPSDEFADLAALNDGHLAAIFGVPLVEIAEKRADLDAPSCC